MKTKLIYHDFNASVAQCKFALGSVSGHFESSSGHSGSTSGSMPIRRRAQPGNSSPPTGMPNPESREVLHSLRAASLAPPLARGAQPPSSRCPVRTCTTPSSALRRRPSELVGWASTACRAPSLTEPVVPGKGEYSCRYAL